MLTADTTRASLYICMSNNQYGEVLHCVPLMPTPSAGVKNGSVTNGVDVCMVVSTPLAAYCHVVGCMDFMFAHPIGEPAEAWHAHFTPFSQNDGPVLSNIHMKVASVAPFTGSSGTPIPAAPVHEYVTLPPVADGHDMTWFVVFTHHVLTFAVAEPATTKHGPNRENSRFAGEFAKYMPPAGHL